MQRSMCVVWFVYGICKDLQEETKTWSTLQNLWPSCYRTPVDQPGFYAQLWRVNLCRTCQKDAAIAALGAVTQTGSVLRPPAPKQECITLKE